MYANYSMYYIATNEAKYYIIDVTSTSILSLVEILQSTDNSKR